MDLIQRFLNQFPGDQPRLFFSPGRVNLIGEHIDYNGGFVFPAAIHLGTYGAVRKRKDALIRLYSYNFMEQGLISTDLHQLHYDDNQGWANYAIGIIHELMQRGAKIACGFDLLIWGNLPPQSGLSSSASLEVLVAYICNTLYDLGLSRQEMALLGQHVENHFMGMHCGIMDQLAISSGMKDHGLLMNTDTLEVVPARAQFEGYTWLIMNTNYKRKTTESKYNERVKECKEALQKLAVKKRVVHLCEYTISDLDWIHQELTDPILWKRVRHVVTEQARTILAKTMMEEHDVMGFAKLLDQSHQSLKEDYEVTGIYLDTLVGAAKASGACGARVTGAGFGGCAIALVRNDQIKSIQQDISRIYQQKTGLMPSFYVVHFVDGVRELTGDDQR
jgi:galactokinase